MFQGSEHLGRSSSSAWSSRTAACSTDRRASTSRTTSRSCPRNTLRPCSGPRRTACAASTITQENLTNQQGVVKNEVQGQRAQPAVRRLPVARPAAGREHQLVQRAQLLRRPRATSTRRRSTTCEQFFKTYYAPNNAVLVVSGDIDPAQTLAWVQQYFGGIPLDAAAAAARHHRAAAGEGEARRRKAIRSRRARRSPSATTRPSGTRRSSTRWA